MAKRAAKKRVASKKKTEARATPTTTRRVKSNYTSDAGGSYFAAPKDKLHFISTGCTMLDLALGGGWCEGRVCNIIGDKATGKTLLAIESAANFHMKRPKAKIRYRECESAFDDGYARALGFPSSSIVDRGQPLLTVEDFYEDLEAIVEGAKGPEFVILDSLDALSDRAELARDIDEGTFGAAKAKKLSELFRRLVGNMERKQITLLIISQVRDKINAMFGRKWTRSGGKALDFYSSQTLVLANTGRITQTIRGQKLVVGVEVLAKVDKNKVSLPYREAGFDIRFGYGVDDAQSMVDYLASTNMLKEADILKDEVKGFLNYLLDLPRDRMNGELAHLRSLCTRTWYEIEAATLTPRTKYGN